MKVLFAITSLNQGGAEKVLVDLTNELSKTLDVTVLTFYGHGDFESNLSKDVKLKSIFDRSYNELSKIEKKLMSLKLVNKYLRKKLYKKYIGNNYDVNIAFLEGPVTWLISEAKCKKIAWVHNDIEQVFNEFKTSSMKQKLNHESYLKYDELVFVSKHNLNKFNEYFKDINVHKQVITNYVNAEEIKKKAEEKIKFDTTLNFVQVSRLVPQKNVSRLIDVHKKLIDDGLTHNIYVLGDGPLKEELVNKVNDLKLTKTFHLMGGMSNPYPYVKAADAFILTSNFEGYPVSLIEAKILNKYIMVTSSASNEVLEDYDSYNIVDNSEEGIYNGLKELITSKLSTSNKVSYDNHGIIDEVIKLVSDKK